VTLVVACVYSLEQHTGWKEFGLIGENPARGAQLEFIRRRQAYYVRQVKEEAAPPLWAQLRQKSPGLLSDCPTPGRKIGWEAVATAELPLFGQTRMDELNTSEIATDAAAAARFEEHFAREQREERRHAMEEARRERRAIVQLSCLVVTVAATVAWVSLNDFANPVVYLEPPIAPPNETQV